MVSDQVAFAVYRKQSFVPSRKVLIRNIPTNDTSFQPEVDGLPHSQTSESSLAFIDASDKSRLRFLEPESLADYCNTKEIG
jgi:hypothetical protein